MSQKAWSQLALAGFQELLRPAVSPTLRDDFGLSIAEVPRYAPASHVQVDAIGFWGWRDNINARGHWSKNKQ